MKLYKVSASGYVWINAHDEDEALRLAKEEYSSCFWPDPYSLEIVGDAVE